MFLAHILNDITITAQREDPRFTNFLRSIPQQVNPDAEVVFRDKGYSIGVSSKTISKPVYAVVFDQKGLLAGTSLVGAKYSRLIR